MQLLPRLFVLAYASKKVRVVLAFAICCKREQQRGEDKAMSERRTLIQHARFLCDSGPFFCPHIQTCLLSGQCSGRVLALCLRFFLALAIPRENSSAFSRSLNRSAALPRMPAVTFREQPLWHKAYYHAHCKKSHGFKGIAFAGAVCTDEEAYFSPKSVASALLLELWMRKAIIRAILASQVIVQPACLKKLRAILLSPDAEAFPFQHCGKNAISGN